MLIQALRAKLSQRGPLGFAADALELGAKLYVTAVWQAVGLAGALTGCVVGIVCEMAEYRERP